MILPLTTEELYQYGSTTVLADWVVRDEDLSAQAVALYTRICFFAQDAAIGGTELTIDKEWADWACGGDSTEPLKELVERRALTKVARFRGGGARYRTEQYPPIIQDILARRIDRDDVDLPSVA